MGLIGHRLVWLVARVRARPIICVVVVLGLVAACASLDDGDDDGLALEPVEFSEGTFRLSGVALAEISRDGDEICVTVLLDEFRETGGGCWSSTEHTKRTISEELFGTTLATHVDLGPGVSGRWLTVAYSIDESVELVRLGFEQADGSGYRQDVEVSEGVFAFVVPTRSELTRVAFVSPSKTLECKTDGFAPAFIVSWQC